MNEAGIVKDPRIDGKTLQEIAKMDSSGFAKYTSKINAENEKPAVPMSRVQFKQYADSMIRNGGFNIAGIRYNSKAAYDSALATGKIKHSWLLRQLIYKVIEVKVKYHNNGDEIQQALLSNLLHSLPQMLFISLPLLALLLKLLYFRRKNFYYVNHGIFSIHFYIFVFIALLFIFGLSELNIYLGWGLINFIRAAIIVFLFIYEYKAMRNFYQQRRGKTIVKYILLNLMFFFVILILFAVFFFLSIFKI